MQRCATKVTLKLLDSTEKSATGVRKTASRNQLKKKKAERAGDLLRNKTDKIDKITKTAPKSVLSKSITSMQTDVTLKEMDIPPEKRQQINDELKLI